MMRHLRNAASPLKLCRPAAPATAVTEKPMSDVRPSRSVVKAILTDLQFWVPVAVLAAGLMVLRWIS